MDELALRAVIRHEPGAVREFVREYAPIFMAVIRRIVVGRWREKEDDLLQDILLGLFRNEARVLRMWDPQKGRSLKTFLQHFAQQRTIDFLRQQQRNSREVPIGDSSLLQENQPAPEAKDMEVPEWVEQLHARFRTEFSPEDQRIVEMTYVQELSVREVARALGLSEDVVYQRRHRLKQRLLKMKGARSEPSAPPAYTEQADRGKGSDS